MNKTCQSCFKRPAVKQVISSNRKAKLWKCQICIERKNENDLSIKNKFHIYGGGL